MLRLPRISTLFPYTTLFRSGSAKDELARSFQWPNGKRMALSLSFDDGRSSQVDTGLALLRRHDVKVTFFIWPLKRSEEHTSELQSHSDLVCRLLLEKKK